jgi:hypothetical protein
MIDPAPGWQLRCPTCGRTRPFGEVGVRIGAASVGKRILGWCTACRKLTAAIVEKVEGPHAAPAVIAPTDAARPPG